MLRKSTTPNFEFPSFDTYIDLPIYTGLFHHPSWHFSPNNMGGLGLCEGLVMSWFSSAMCGVGVYLTEGC
ncbi:hypothetical protein CsSME_00032546 [Camellia sinensis var. sinensis]